MLRGLASAGAIGIPLCSVPCSKSPTASPCMHHVSLLSPVEKQEKTTPVGVNLMRSQVLYRAAQGLVLYCMSV